MSSRTIPPLLEPYTRLPPSTSLTLLTSVLSASTNWLVLRYLYAALASAGQQQDEASAESDVAVVLVSFLRDGEFWREGARRMGLDLRRLAVQGRFAFVDGLTELFAPPASQSPSASPSYPIRPARGPGAVPPRGPLGVQAPGGAPISAASAPTAASIPQTTVLDSPKLESVGESIKVQIRRLRTATQGQAQTQTQSPASVGSGLNGPRSAASSARAPPAAAPFGAAPAGGGAGSGRPSVSGSQQERKVLLIVDQPDVLLATTGVNATDMVNWVFGLREQVHSTTITLAADAPLVQSPTTPLEQAHASFLLSLAHQARLTVSLRLLDTGTAKDVSGVMQFTRGADELDDKTEDEHLEDKELLYFIAADGAAKVFERGT
ncbi:hypothetical protein L228DRAFT_250173 [Xylona heveae TC161]|uniref:Elongator complex protein 6 n=1 Tax=Xylona heveae (strain CBS 132557 / TC161) TaxID=1328760 RepID=A0A165AHB2_XYLHT|nr:hypothetical protein L228DRAFT_250173 [Xylona heveae TC161]KZF20473.1 hypothetical protein L228DRAFT_250173 [Xylona heveae TC161]